MYRKNKNLGQHFLKDQAVLDSIISFVDLVPGKSIYEIGPGAGALTTCLVNHGLTVCAIELDQRWCHWLKKNFDGQTLSVINQDALQYPWAALRDQDVIVGNLPYNIASELMCLWVETQVHLKHAVLMMQKEVADRAMAKPGSKHYGRLSIMLQTYFSVESLLAVPPEAFDPPPKVQSTIIRLSPLSKPLCESTLLGSLKKVTAAAFSQRRKKCKHGLSTFFSVDDLIRMNIDPELRPESLDIQAFIKLAKHCHKNEL